MRLVMRLSEHIPAHTTQYFIFYYVYKCTNTIHYSSITKKKEQDFTSILFFIIAYLLLSDLYNIPVYSHSNLGLM